MKIKNIVSVVSMLFVCATINAAEFDFDRAAKISFSELLINIPVFSPPAEKDFRRTAGNFIPVACLGDEVICKRPLVYTDSQGRLFKNGQFLGYNSGNYETSCVEDVIWKDPQGAIYKNNVRLGSSCREFLVNEITGDVVWKNDYTVLYKNSDRLGISAVNFMVSGRTGDVAWSDSSNNLYKNSERIAYSVVSYEINRHTGDIVWQNNFGKLGKNSSVLGDGINTFETALCSGDIVWIRNGNIYKNGNLLGSAVEFKLEPDGRLLWKDAFGQYHIS